MITLVSFLTCKHCGEQITPPPPATLIGKRTPNPTQAQALQMAALVDRLLLHMKAKHTAVVQYDSILSSNFGGVCLMNNFDGLDQEMKQASDRIRHEVHQRTRTVFIGTANIERKITERLPELTPEQHKACFELMVEMRNLIEERNRYPELSNRFFPAEDQPTEQQPPAETPASAAAAELATSRKQ